MNPAKIILFADSPVLQAGKMIKFTSCNFTGMDDFRLRVFLAVARTGSFTTAAGQMGISQPAVSQNIGGLENELGSKLFVRSRHSAVLTEEGRVFLPYAEQIVHWYDAAGRMFGSGVRKTGTLDVTVAASGDLLVSVIPDLLLSVSAVNPDIRFHVSECGDAVPEPDISVRTGVLSGYRGEELSGMELIGTSEACVVVSSSSPLAFGNVTARERGDMAFWTGAGRAADVLPADMLPNVRFESSSAAFVKNCILSSPGLQGILPYHLVSADVAGGVLSLLPHRSPLYTITAGLSVSEKFGRNPLCGFLREKLRSYFH